jgi:hypothetical protein
LCGARFGFGIGLDGPFCDARKRWLFNDRQSCPQNKVADEAEALVLKSLGPGLAP